MDNLGRLHVVPVVSVVPGFLVVVVLPVVLVVYVVPVIPVVLFASVVPVLPVVLVDNWRRVQVVSVVLVISVMF